MTVKYVQFTVCIHGLDADPAALGQLTELLRDATLSALLGQQSDKFKFRNEFDSDIEVELVEQAGS
jgi:hypothetical protein